MFIILSMNACVWYCNIPLQKPTVHNMDYLLLQQTDNPLITSLADSGLIGLLGQRLHFVEPEVYECAAKAEKTHHQLLQTSING